MIGTVRKGDTDGDPTLIHREIAVLVIAAASSSGSCAAPPSA